MFILQLTNKNGSGKPRWLSKLKKELLRTPTGCQNYGGGRLQEVNEWGKKGRRCTHFSAKVTVGLSESEEIRLKRTKKQLWEVGL